jgi:predicted SAM-dependent methyltransferase
MSGAIRAIYRKTLPLSVRVNLRKVLTRYGGALGHHDGWDRVAIAEKYLRGDGIEIGALNSPLQVPREARVKYVDRMATPDLRKQYPELADLDLVDADIIDDGERLDSIEDSTQDFVIANHFIEHCQNPLLALSNMFRVLKVDGLLYLAVPDKRFTFDVDRPVTPLEHILRDFEEGGEWSRRQHFEEWVRDVNKVEDKAEFEKRVEELLGIDYSIHFHAWTQLEMLEFVLALDRRLGIRFDVEMLFKNGEECIFILRKTG